MAMIGQLPATLEDRSIVLRIKRKTSSETVERFRPRKLSDELETLRRKAVRWAKDNLDALKDADPEVPDALNDRAQDNWRPLLAIADAVGEPWPEAARKAAQLLSGPAGEEDQSAGVQLLADLRDLFRKERTDFLASKHLVESLVEMEERPWPEFRKGKPITVRQLAALLAKFSVRPKQERTDNSIVRGYELSTLQDPFARYLDSDPLQPLQANKDAPWDAFSHPLQNASVTDRQSGPEAHKQRTVTDVTDRNRVSAKEGRV